jgi:hypothetical protein
MEDPSHHSEATDAARARGPIAFATTHWSRILAADEGDRDRALFELVQLYREAILAYFRLKFRFYEKWATYQDPEDLTQAFIEHVMAGRFLVERMDRQKCPRFRYYLLAALRNFLMDQVDKLRAGKRGGDAVLLPMDQPGMPARVAADDPDPDLAPTLTLEVAQAIHRRIMDQLASQLKAGETRRRFDRLRRFILLKPGEGDYAAAAQELEVTQDNVTKMIARWRSDYSARFRAEIAQMVTGAPEDIQAEVKELLGALFQAVESGAIAV